MQEHSAVLGKIINKEHIYDYFIDYNETDAGGIVYHANYISIAEKARAAFYRLIGGKYKKETFFVVKTMNINYILPAKFDQCLQVKSKITKVGSFKVAFEQNFFYSNTLLCSLSLNLASIGSNLKLKQINNDYKNILTMYLL